MLLHDGPTDDVEEVWVEFSSVRVHGDDGWSVVSNETQALDLLALQDGVVAELGLSELEPGDYGQLRLDVTDSWVIVDGERQPLRIPSGEQSGLKIEHGFSLPECGTLTITLDWDAGAHLHHNKGQGFILRPVLEVESETIESDGCDGPPDRHVDDAAGFVVASDDLELYTLGNGNLLTYGAGGGTVVSPAGTVLDQTFPDPGHRVTLWVPPATENRPDLVTGAYDGLVALAATGEVAWTWQALPCCNARRIPAAVDPATGQVYHPGNYRVFQFDGRNGANRGATGSHGDFTGFIALAPNRIWKAGVRGRVTLYQRRTTLVGAQPLFTLVIGNIPLRPPALASDGSAVLSAGGDPYMNVDDPGELLRVLDSRSIAWRVDAGAVTPPVIGAGDVVFVGASPADGVYSVDAYSLDGALLWSAPVSARPTDLAVGDDGLLYAAAGSEVVGLDQATGELALRYHGLSAATQILLDSGTLYVSDTTAVYALPVSATGYDPNAPWPVRFHDNQRTSSL